ncbi:MAG: sulfatase [Planctomycetes bacterium]|nr:sulfatase [Planctomycetota bacterium]
MKTPFPSFALILFAVAGLVGAADKSSQGTRPNIVLILVDDLGWMDLGCQGSTFYETPNIDRLAAQGMRFTNAYAACAVCSPTRAAVMTGRYPARVGVTDWIRARFQRGGIGTPAANPTEYVRRPNGKLWCPPNPYWMEHSELTLAEMLKPAGYRSCHIGKWHLGDDDWYPTAQGFDENYGGCDYGQPPSYFDPYQNRRLTEGIPFLPSRKPGEYLSDREADEAVEFIRRNRNNPFFLYMANYAVHTPIQAKAEVTAKYQAKTKTNQTDAKYAAMVESVDDAVGRIMAALAEYQLTRNTLVIFTSDNGGLDRKGRPTDNAPLRSGKGYPYEGGIRVPFIVHWPGVVQPQTLSHEPVISVDILPTILQATQVATGSQAIDGVSLMEHVRSGGTTALNRDALYWHFPHYRHSPGPYSIIRSGDWKLIHYYEGIYELYNLREDLAEAKNLAQALPEKVQELDAKLTRHLKAVGAKLPRETQY